MKTIFTALSLLLTFTVSSQCGNHIGNHFFQVGSGNQFMSIMIDFNDGNHFDNYSFIYQYDNNNPPTYKEALLDFASLVPSLEITLTELSGYSFVTGVQYNSHQQPSGGTDQGWFVKQAFGNGWTAPCDGWLTINLNYTVPNNTWLYLYYNADNNGFNPDPFSYVALNPNNVDYSQITSVGQGSKSNYIAIDFGPVYAPNYWIWEVRHDYSQPASAGMLLMILTLEGVLVKHEYENEWWNIEKYTWTHNGETKTLWWEDAIELKGINSTDFNPNTPPNHYFDEGDWLYYTNNNSIPRMTQFSYAPPQSLSTTTFNTTFSVYPNPTTDFVNINTTSDIKQVNIYDLQGRLISTQYSDRVDLQNNQKGIYVLEVVTEQSKHTQKIIKQ